MGNQGRIKYVYNRKVVYREPNSVIGERLMKMETPVCPTYGSSLVRLGIGKDETVSYHHPSDPAPYLRFVSDVLFPELPL